MIKIFTKLLNTESTFLNLVVSVILKQEELQGMKIYVPNQLTPEQYKKQSIKNNFEM